MLLLLLLSVSGVYCDVERLPDSVVPTHYDLFLGYHFGDHDEFPFYGLVNIKIIAQKETDKIVLHSKNLTIDDKTTLTGEDSILVKSASHNDVKDFLTIQLDKPMTVNQAYTLSIPFRGNVSIATARPFGIYVGSYIDSVTGNKENFIATLLEWNKARAAFPCFDEPALKATFRIVIGHHQNYTSVSNMPLLKSSNDNPMEDSWPWKVISETFNNMDEKSYIWDHFDLSVPMSTYLVALSVNKFTYSETSTKESGVKIRVWSTPDTQKQRAYALKIAPKLVSFYEKMFNIPYALPKLDIVCVPVIVVAMENWGLIMMGTSESLYDAKRNSRLHLIKITAVIAHEIGHQWFGDLVTMKWWSDLWLKEGLATFLQVFGIDYIEPSFQILPLVIEVTSHHLLQEDSYQETHPVIKPKNFITQTGLYNGITYHKGGLLTRMMSLILGEELFNKALNSYLTKYSYNNTDSDDFLNELEAVSYDCSSFQDNVTVKMVMDSWLKQPGFPLLTVNRSYEDNTMALTQARFFGIKLPKRAMQSWWIPVKMLVEGTQSNRPSDNMLWISDEDGLRSGIKIEHRATPDQWVLLNVDAIAPLRVNYDQRNWDLLIMSLKKNHQSIPVISRIQLIIDSFMLAYNGVIDYSVPLDLISYLQYETEDQPFTAGVLELNTIGQLLQMSSGYGAFQKFYRMLITPVYDRVGGLCCKEMKQSKHDFSKLNFQVTIVQEACSMNVPDCEEKAVKMFDKWMKSDDPDLNNPIPIDHRPTVYCVGISRGSVTHWRFLLARYQKSQSDLEKKSLLNAMRCSRDVWIIQELLELSLENGPSFQVPLEELAKSTAPVAEYVVKRFVTERIDDIHDKLSNQSFLTLIANLIRRLQNKKEIEDFLSLLESKKYIDRNNAPIKMALENVQLKLDWMEKHKTRVLDIVRNMTM